MFCFRTVAVFLLTLLLPVSANADISVRLSIDRTEVTLLDSVRLVVSISGTQSTKSKPVIRGLKEFTVSQGGTSSRLEIINGQVNATAEHTFFIQPQKVGAFEIGPAEVKIKGASLKSNTATLKVTKTPQNQSAARGPLFLQVSISSNEAYLEEQVIYTLKLYRAIKVNDLSLDLPEEEYLAFKQLGKPVEYQSRYGDGTYQVLEIRCALMPSKVGTHTIGPAKMTMTVFQPRQRSGRSLFDDPFFDGPFFGFSRGRPMTLSSEPLELEVRALPEENRPPDFSGLVGTFEMESQIEPSQVMVGESATLTVLVRGRGNVNRIPDLKLPELTESKVYADQPVFEMTPDDKGLAGTKTMKWAIVPEKDGPYQIPSLRISFFDTTNHQYDVATTRSHAISVLPSTGQDAEASIQPQKEIGAEGSTKQAIKQLGRDILPVHTSIKDLTRGTWTRPEGPVFWILMLGPIIVYAAAFCGLRFKKKSAQAKTAIRMKKAAKMFTRQCRQRELSSTGLAEAAKRYLNDRFELYLGAVTPDEAAEILISRGVDRATAHKFQSHMQRLEEDIYAGRGDSPCTIGQDMCDVVKQIEREVR
ncbi:MAG: protein BatD [Deltaproteobacteria bacterium]|nr:protein BatD [Deltaproteobacteria bacterium]MBW2330183.1 protein BatD [Deltaproteobacteria bacterium]